MNIIELIMMFKDFKFSSKKGNMGFTMIIKIVLAIALLLFFLFMVTGARESMMSGIRKIFTFGR
jgi:hypothetical protein